MGRDGQDGAGLRAAGVCLHSAPQPLNYSPERNETRTVPGEGLPRLLPSDWLLARRFGKGAAARLIAPETDNLPAPGGQRAWAWGV